MSSTEHWIGHTLAGRYRIRRLIGSGGMGAVFEGEHLELGKRVAIKLLTAARFAAAEAEARLQQEARSASAVESEHIVDVYDVGRDPSAGLYMVMEFLEGEDLEARLLRETRLDVATSVVIASQIARGLAKAHACGVVHRDLKPANVFLVPRDDGSLVVKLVDFGIAKFRRAATTTGSRLTRDGVAVGTVQYMAPEQAQLSESADHRVDIWGLGAVLYECLSGQPAYPDMGSYEQTLVQIITTSPPPLTEFAPFVPPALANVVHEALRHNPDARPWDCFTFHRMLEEAVPECFTTHGVHPQLTGAGRVPVLPRNWPGGIPGRAPISIATPRTPQQVMGAPLGPDPFDGYDDETRRRPLSNPGVEPGRPIRRRAKAALSDDELLYSIGLKRRGGALRWVLGLTLVAAAGVFGARTLVAKRPSLLPAITNLVKSDKGAEASPVRSAESAPKSALPSPASASAARAVTHDSPVLAATASAPGVASAPRSDSPPPPLPPEATSRSQRRRPRRSSDSASESTFGGVSVTDDY